jgi:hypothetical protein
MDPKWKPTTPMTIGQILHFRRAVRAYYDYTNAAGTAHALFPDWELNDFCDTVKLFADCQPGPGEENIEGINEEHIMACFDDEALTKLTADD